MQHPEHVMTTIRPKIAPCLWFASEAEEAANFYVPLFPDSRVDEVQRNVMDSPGGRKGTVLVVQFTLAGQRFLALNGGIHVEYTDALSLQVDCEDQAEVDRLWEALSAGGEEVQCGWLKDRYGVRWQIVPTMLLELLADPDPAKATRVMQAMLQMVKLDIAGLLRAYDGT
jgi:predicted 3-demethylubiquinone-9 3-methyltransferase (glyoxalase superfamily)